MSEKSPKNQDKLKQQKTAKKGRAAIAADSRAVRQRSSFFIPRTPKAEMHERNRQNTRNGIPPTSRRVARNQI